MWNALASCSPQGSGAPLKFAAPERLAGPVLAVRANLLHRPVFPALPLRVAPRPHHRSESLARPDSPRRRHHHRHRHRHRRHHHQHLCLPLSESSPDRAELSTPYLAQLHKSMQTDETVRMVRKGRKRCETTRNDRGAEAAKRCETVEKESMRRGSAPRTDAKENSAKRCANRCDAARCEAAREKTAARRDTAPSDAKLSL